MKKKKVLCCPTSNYISSSSMSWSSTSIRHIEDHGINVIFKVKKYSDEKSVSVGSLNGNEFSNKPNIMKLQTTPASIYQWVVHHSEDHVINIVSKVGETPKDECICLFSIRKWVVIQTF